MALVAVFFHRVTVDAPKALLHKMADQVDLQAKSVRYTQVGSSGMKWEMVADSVQYQKRNDLALFENLKVKVIMKDGRIFVMTGNRGVLNTRTRDIDIDGDVVFVSHNGDRLRTDSLKYRDRLKRIETDRPVVIENENTHIKGVGMILTLKDQKLAILSGVHAQSFAR